MMLELRKDGGGKFATAANLGNPQMDRSVEATLTIPEGKWLQESGELVLTGNRADGKPTAHRFTLQENGDLTWKQTGARFYRSR
ncbi:MAG: hypothetical protein EXS37_06535 [Opitutus sp.]|nr:hypothetical protein [Opitutus sp.]